MNRYIREQIVLGEGENVDEKHIVLCGDKEYIKYCGVTLTSVLLSNPEDNFVFHIFCDDVSDIDLKRLGCTCKKFNKK